MLVGTTLPARTAAKHRHWTYDELRAELGETNQPCELWQGRLIMPPAPAPFHQIIAHRLEEALHKWVDQRRLGFVFGAPLDVVLAPDLTFQPDVLFVARSHRDIIKDERIEGPPDLIMEVVSPDRPRRDYKDKKDQYEALGVREYWIVDPDRNRIEVWTLRNDLYQLAGAYSGRQSASSLLLTGFKIKVDRLLMRYW